MRVFPILIFPPFAKFTSLNEVLELLSSHEARNDRKDIDIKWIEATYSFPEKELIQLDGRIRRWKYIKEVNRYFMIVILEDKETVQNAFFDRSYK